MPRNSSAVQLMEEIDIFIPGPLFISDPNPNAAVYCNPELTVALHRFPCNFLPTRNFAQWVSSSTRKKKKRKMSPKDILIRDFLVLCCGFIRPSMVISAGRGSKQGDRRRWRKTFFSKMALSDGKVVIQSHHTFDTSVCRRTNHNQPLLSRRKIISITSDS